METSLILVTLPAQNPWLALVGDGALEGGCPGSREAGSRDKAPGCSVTRFLAVSTLLAGSAVRLALDLPEPG